MPRHCSAYGCTNNAEKQSCKEKNISFHRFPLKNKELMKIWTIQVRRKSFTPNAYSFLCSEHFTDDDFCYQAFTNRRQIKKDAVPSIFLYKPAVKRESTSYKFGASVSINTVPEPEPASRDASCQTDTSFIDILVEKNSKLEDEVKELKEEIQKRIKQDVIDKQRDVEKITVIVKSEKPDS